MVNYFLLYNAFSVICLLVPFSIQRADEHFEPLQIFLFKVVITQFFIWWDKYKKFTVKKYPYKSVQIYLFFNW
jgi:hypothetical protein